MRSILIWPILAVFAGTWLGIISRIVMRIVAVEAEVTPGFSAGGTLEVLAFSIILGAPTALLFWAYRRKWYLPPWFGIVIGILLFFVLLVFQPPAAKSALAGTPDTPLFTAVLFAFAFASYGALLDAIWHFAKQR